MNDVMHHELIRQVAQDRVARLTRDADAHRLAREATGRGSMRRLRPGVAELFPRLRLARRSVVASS